MDSETVIANVGKTELRRIETADSWHYIVAGAEYGRGRFLEAWCAYLDAVGWQDPLARESAPRIGRDCE